MRGAEGTTSIRVNNLVGAQEAFVLLGVRATGIKNHLFIATDKEEAVYLQNTLDNLHPDGVVSLFPDSFKRPLRFAELDNHNILQRTEAINRINQKSGQGEIIVSYPEAIFEKVVKPSLLDAHRIELKKGEDLDLDTIIEFLIDYGFERTDFVFEPGQFSVRGGIVDIFSFGNEWPYRVELLDEEVESIRMFNPATQLSIRNIGKVSIIPNVKGKFGQDDKVPLFEVLSGDTLIWIKDWDMLLDRIQSCFEKADTFGNELALMDDDKLKEIFKERAFIYPQDIVSYLKEHKLVFLSNSDFGCHMAHTLEFDGKPQPSFNRSFNLLIEDLNKNTASGLENFIFTDSTKQIERFYSIFEDLDAHVRFHPISQSIHNGFIDHKAGVACYTDHQIFERFHRYKLRKGFTRQQAINLRMLRELRKGDFVVHIDHGVGRFSGLEKIDINGRIQESVRLFYKNDDILYVGINSLHKISRYIGKDGTPPKLDKIGSDSWKALKRKTKKKVKDIAKELIKLYAKRKASPGFSCQPDGYLQTELEASFIYEDTPDQLQTTIDVKADMEKPYPMDRLICGDVGFGKTEIAIRAAFKAAVNGKQVAVLVPTTILALQHYKTFSERLKDFPISVDYINRFKSATERKKTMDLCKSGELDIVIGTHALLSKNTGFKDLGLLVIDEEQKFGVSAKEKLKKIKINVDNLTLTATPIPRTLQFSLLSARDLSIIKTPPPNRQPIHTERRVFNDEIIKESIYFEVHRGGQVFFVHNRVKSLPDMAAMIKKLCPDVEVAVAHGQMEPKHLENTLVDFIDKNLMCSFAPILLKRAWTLPMQIP